MRLRTRLTVAGGGAVFVALALAFLVVYFDVRSKLHDQIDISLIREAQRMDGKLLAANRSTLEAGTPSLSTLPRLTSDASIYLQVIPSLGAALKEPHAKPVSGKPTRSLGTLNGFSVIAEDARVANGGAPPYFRNVRYHGAAMRLYTMRVVPTGDGLVRTARPLSETNATLARVRWLLIGLTLGGAVAAALLGRLAAAALLRPVRALAGAARDVRATRDLNRRIPVEGRDELASLAADFNAMLAALAESQRAQQQLIADASHELRTPLTAHRANVELLARPDLPPERRPHVLRAAVRGIEELSALVNDLIQAARNGRPVEARDRFSLDDVIAAAVERAQHRAPQLRFETQLEPYPVTASRSRVERAIDNVLDNACKWSSPGGVIQVGLSNGTVTVRDHGPGIEQADLPHVFDRFYRATAARAMPGSGLGLAIVKETAETHGGSATVANAPSGGVLVTVRFDTLTNL